MEENKVKKEEIKEEKKLSKGDFLLIILIIFLLSGTTYWHFKNWRKSLTGVELPEFEMPKFEFPSKKEEGYKEWSSPDGKLKIKYPADWIEMDIRTLESYIQREMEEKPLFLAQKLVIEKSTLAFLTINKLKSEEGLSVEEILEKMKEDTQKREGEMKVLKLEIKDKEAIFEAKYSKKDGPTFQSKEKLILDEKIYLVSFFSFEKNFPEFEKEAEEIINSVQLLE